MYFYAISRTRKVMKSGFYRSIFFSRFVLVFLIFLVFAAVRCEYYLTSKSNIQIDRLESAKVAIFQHFFLAEADRGYIYIFRRLAGEIHPLRGHSHSSTPLPTSNSTSIKYVPLPFTAVLHPE